MGHKNSKITCLDKDKIKALKSKRKNLIKLWMKYSKKQKKTKEEEEFCDLLFCKLCEYNLYDHK